MPRLTGKEQLSAGHEIGSSDISSNQQFTSVQSPHNTSPTESLLTITIFHLIEYQFMVTIIIDTETQLRVI